MRQGRGAASRAGRRVRSARTNAAHGRGAPWTCRRPRCDVGRRPLGSGRQPSGGGALCIAPPRPPKGKKHKHDVSGWGRLRIVAAEGGREPTPMLKRGVPTARCHIGVAGPARAQAGEERAAAVCCRRYKRLVYAAERHVAAQTRDGTRAAQNWGERWSGGGGRVCSSLPTADGARHGWWSDELKRPRKVRGVEHMPGTYPPLPPAKIPMARRGRVTALGGGEGTVAQAAWGNVLEDGNENVMEEGEVGVQSEAGGERGGREAVAAAPEYAWSHKQRAFLPSVRVRRAATEVWLPSPWWRRPTSAQARCCPISPRRALPALAPQ